MQLWFFHFRINILTLFTYIYTNGKLKKKHLIVYQYSQGEDYGDYSSWDYSYSIEWNIN